MFYPRRFHFAGVSAKNVTLGIPRLKELFHASKKIKTPNVMFRCSDPTLSIEPQTNIEDITSTIHLSYTLPTDNWVTRWCAIFNLDAKMLHEPNWIVMTLRPSITDAVWRILKDAIESAFVQEEIVVIQTHPTDIEHPSLVVHFVDASQELYSLKLWNTVRKTILSVYLYGILNRNAAATYEKGWYSLGDTSLTPCVMRAIVDLHENHTGVDLTSVTSNNPRDILEILGIEAARATLLKELSDVLKFDGTYVDKRHPLLLVDAMTMDGTILPMNRTGIKKSASALSFASFEMATVSLAEAAMHEKVDPMTGVAERIIVGRMANIGTNANIQLILDEEKLQHSFNLVENAEEKSQMDFGMPPVIEPLLDVSPALSEPFSQFSPAWGAQFSPEREPHAPSPSSPMYSPSTPCYSPDAHDIYVPPSPDYMPSSPASTPPTELLDVAVNSLFT